MRNMIARWWQSLGFGIQSKTDFAFLHDVLREGHRYYIYDELTALFPDAGRSSQRMAQLFFRVCNHVSPSEVIFQGEVSDILRTTCKRAVCKTHKSGNQPMLIVGKGSSEPIQDNLSAVIVMDINSCNKTLWERLLSQPTITFDMTDIGIALFPENRYPEHYAIKKMW